MGKHAVILVPMKARWMEEHAEHREQHGSRKKLKKEYETQAEKRLADEWDSILNEHSSKSSRHATAAQLAPLSHKKLRIHAQLAKAESSLATQICTEKIGLADFLHRQRVPRVTPPECPCS